MNITTDPCDKVKPMDELDRQVNALHIFIDSNIKPNSEDERVLLDKLIETEAINFIFE